MLSFKVTTVGSSSGIILSKAAMAQLRVRKGDTLFLTEAPTAATGSPPTIPTSSARWRSRNEIMHDDREVLRALAK